MKSGIAFGGLLMALAAMPGKAADYASIFDLEKETLQFTAEGNCKPEDPGITHRLVVTDKQVYCLIPTLFHHSWAVVWSVPISELDNVKVTEIPKLFGGVGTLLELRTTRADGCPGSGLTRRLGAPPHMLQPGYKWPPDADAASIARRLNDQLASFREHQAPVEAYPVTLSVEVPDLHPLIRYEDAEARKGLAGRTKEGLQSGGMALRDLSEVGVAGGPALELGGLILATGTVLGIAQGTFEELGANRQVLRTEASARRRAVSESGKASLDAVTLRQKLLQAFTGSPRVELLSTSSSTEASTSRTRVEDREPGEPVTDHLLLGISLVRFDARRSAKTRLSTQPDVQMRVEAELSLRYQDSTKPYFRKSLVYIGPETSLEQYMGGDGALRIAFGAAYDDLAEQAVKALLERYPSPGAFSTNGIARCP